MNKEFKISNKFAISFILHYFCSLQEGIVYEGICYKFYLFPNIKIQYSGDDIIDNGRITQVIPSLTTISFRWLFFEISLDITS